MIKTPKRIAAETIIVLYSEEYLRNKTINGSLHFIWGINIAMRMVEKEDAINAGMRLALNSKYGKFVDNEEIQKQKNMKPAVFCK